MLQQFSWGQFLIAAALLSFLWYVFVLLVFYRAELNAFFGGGLGGDVGSGVSIGGSVKAGLVGESRVGDQEAEMEVDAALMGTSRLPDGVEVKSSSGVAFAATDEDGRYDQVGLVSDVVQELKGAFLELEKSAGDKRDFFRLLERVKEEYGPLGGHPAAGALTTFIVESASFHLTPGEVENLWY
ncbi:hypothetical protein [Pedobacter agri]|uniref:hypothetical protein n=1 Tax=Pedobacter agri TaxID=454586 RepID=UPI00292E3C6F|nr:hypothetical protein [Pedobacter agri]